MSDIFGYQCTYNIWFTFSSRHHEMRWERECEECIHCVYHILDPFLSRLKALGNMSVNCIRVKRHECLASLFKLPSTLSRSSHTRVWMSFVRASSHSHLAKSLDKCFQWECIPGITVLVPVIWNAPAYIIIGEHLLEKVLINARPVNFHQIFLGIQ